ncbi:MAG TPA: ABC transporter permease, partial [Mucilaginibacter sp.]|nr:ABC transporter permease [Mucilaginibacter sp.]
MIKNYLKIAWRNLIRQKLFSLINISGLAIGLAVCMLIMLYVEHEYSYDKFHKNANRIYALTEHLKMNGQELNMQYMSYVTGPIIKQSQPAVADYVRMWKIYKDPIIENPAAARVKFSETNMWFADANFFKVFSFKLLSGSPSD